MCSTKTYRHYTKVTSAYHPQANGLVECQNRTIQGSMLKWIEAKPLKAKTAHEVAVFLYELICRHE